jgi:hypothetical protein
VTHTLGWPALAAVAALLLADSVATQWHMGVCAAELGYDVASFDPIGKESKTNFGVREQPARTVAALVRRASITVAGPRFRGLIESVKAARDALQ